jgi:hypothetical protein
MASAPQHTQPLTQPLTLLAAAIAAYQEGRLCEAALLFIQARYPQFDWGVWRLSQKPPLGVHYCEQMPGVNIDIWSGRGGTIKFMWPHQTGWFPIEGMRFDIQTGHCGAHHDYSFVLEPMADDIDSEDEGVSFF